ncbi:hypothetical protein ACES2L_04825 [Bdellovibrio bacteriovorus]
MVKRAVLILATMLMTCLASAETAPEGFWIYQDPAEIQKQKDILAPGPFSYKAPTPSSPLEGLHGIIRIHFNDVRDVPEMYRKFLPGETFDRPRGITLYFAVSNDYNVLNPLAVGADTDDHGHTHGANIAIGGFLPSGHYLTFSYSTDLYTHPIDGTAKQLEDGGREVAQNFTTETVLKFVLDNIDNARAQTFYWKAEAGWHQLKSDNPGGFFHGATHQEKFHELVNSFKPGQTKTPNYVNDGEKTRDGFIMGLMVGVAKEYLFAKNVCRVRGFAETGGRGSTIEGASYAAANVGGTLWCQANPDSLTYRAEIGHESKLHQDGHEGTPYIDLSLGKRSWRIGFRVQQAYGDLMNYVNYNRKNIDNGKIDPIFMLYYRHSF